MGALVHEDAGILNVLVVEDSPSDAALLASVLNHAISPSMKVSLRYSESLACALERLNDGNFDVILLDLNLPDSSAQNTLKFITAASEHIPIVIVSAIDDANFEQETLVRGVQDYIVKGTLDGDAIYRIIRKAITRKRSSLMETAAPSVVVGHIDYVLLASKIGTWNWNFADGELIWDEQMQRIFDISKFDGTYASFAKLVHPDDIESLDRCISDKLAEHALLLESEYRVIWHDGSVHTIEAIARVSYDTAGDPIRMSGICRDITRNRELEESVKRLDIAVMQKEFVAMLVHDLRGPMLGTNRVLEYMIKGSLGPLSDAHADTLRKIIESNHLSLKLINDTLDAYKLESGHEVFNLVNVDLKKLIEHFVHDMEPVATSQNIKLSCTIPELRPALADKMAMQRVLSNLVSNALKFTPANGQIEIGVEERDDMAVLKVRDTGIGIAPQDIDNLFQRFWQVKSHHQSGFGLGLYLCQKLVEAQNGSISCASVQNVGTTFEIRLPLVHA